MLPLFYFILFFSSGRVCAAPTVDLAACGHHRHLHLPGAGRARAPAHLAEERAGPGARRARQTQKQQQVNAQLQRSGVDENAGGAPHTPQTAALLPVWTSQVLILTPARSHCKSPQQGAKAHALMNHICGYLRHNSEIPRLNGFTPDCALTSWNIKVPTQRL